MAGHNEQLIEQEIQDKGKTASRLTPDDIDKVITKEWYTRVENTSVTLCVLFLVNGFSVTGESASVSTDNYDKEIGEKIAKENARQKIWVLEGYLLRQKLFDESSKQ